MSIGVEQVADVEPRLLREILEGEDDLRVGRLAEDLFEIVEFILADQAFGQFGGLCFLASAQLHACHERDGCVV